MKIDIRYTQLEDEKYLLKWLAPADDSLWFPMTLPAEIELASRNWIGFSKYKASLTVLTDEKPCAIGTLFLMPYYKTAHHAMFYMVVDKPYRKKGIGTALLKNLLQIHLQQMLY